MAFNRLIQLLIMISCCFMNSQEKAQILDKAFLLSRNILTQTSYCSNGSDRAQNGKPRFYGPMEAKIMSFNNFQYVSYYEGDGSLVVARKKISREGIWEKSVVQGYKLKSQDRHNKIAMDISKGDGVIHLAFDHHNTPHFNYAKSNVNVATHPESVIWDNSVFKLLPNLGMQANTGLVTYPTFYKFNATGDLIIYWRTGGSVGGEMNLANYNSLDHKWHFIGRISTQEGTYMGKKGTRGPYTGMFAEDTTGILHVAWVFREREYAEEQGKIGHMGEHGLFYAQSSDGGYTWKSNSGNVITDLKNNLIMGIDNMKDIPKEIPLNLNPSHAGLTSVMDLKTNHFITFLAHFKPGTKERKNYMYVRSPKGVWTVQETNLIHQGYIEIEGDNMFVFSESGIYISNRSSSFTEWKTMSFPIQFSKGEANWDTNQLKKGIVSMAIQYAPKKMGEPTPIEVFDFKLTL